jgi:hypothetical protein
MTRALREERRDRWDVIHCVMREHARRRTTSIIQVDVERRRCAKRVVDTHSSPARVACLFNARPVEQLCVFCDHCFDEGGSKVKKKERSWTACIWGVGSEVRIKHMRQMDAGHHDYGGRK